MKTFDWHKIFCVLCAYFNSDLHLAVSLEMWSETFGKNASQRSSLKESMFRHERLDTEDHRIVHVQLQGNYHANIPSIMITSPQGDDNESGNRGDRGEVNETGYEKNKNMVTVCCKIKSIYIE